MTTVLETERTRLRQFTRGDLDRLAEMVADEEQMRFYPRPRSRAEASAWLDRNLRLYEEVGYGFWLMESPSTSEFFGYCGIRPLEIGGVTETEMGWHTAKHFWGRGLATEGALACRDLAFETFGLERLVATIAPEHLASRRVAEKIGMIFEREAELDGWRCVLYASER